MILTDKWVADTGLVLSLVFILLGLWVSEVYMWLAVGSILVTMLFPGLFYPIAWVWLKIAFGLNFVVSKVFFSLVFFLIITPIGIIRQIFGADSLLLSKQESRESALRERVHKYSREDFLKPY